MISDEKHHEPFVEYYENGQLKKEGVYYERKLDGSYREYYRNGELKEEGEYQYGGRLGEYYWYYNNGQLKQYKTFQTDEDGDEFENGKYKKYYENGDLKEVGNISFHVKQYKKYYENGSLKEEGVDEHAGWDIKTYYKNGQLRDHHKSHGLNVKFYEDGQLKEKFYLYDEITEGPFESYYPNGHLKQKGERKVTEFGESLYHGEYELYYENGQIRAKGDYFEGRKKGEYKKYYKNGNLRLRGNYIHKKWRPISLELVYEDGDLKYIDHIDGDNLHVPDVADGIVEKFYENGQLKEMTTFVKGVKDGMFIKLDETGNLIARGIFRDGKLKTT